MLKPAISYKEELEDLFSQEIYTENYFLYSGYTYGHELPKIGAEDNHFQWAIVNSQEEVIGYMAYQVDPGNDTVKNFGLYSFDHSNPTIGKDLFTKMEELVARYRRIEWGMIGGNPVKKHYDRFCDKHGGNCVKLNQVTRDEAGNYRDVYIYEIVRDLECQITKNPGSVNVVSSHFAQE